MRTTISRQTALPWTGELLRSSSPAGRASRPRVADSALPVDEPVDTSPGVNGHTPRDYQVAASEWLRKRRRALLGDEIGLGKTVEVLRAFPKKVQAIVVCPAYLRYVWRDECALWRPDLCPCVENELREPIPGEVLILSYESLPPPAPGARLTLRPELALRRVYFAVDEAHYCKNPHAQRTRRVSLLANQVGHVWPLTGTPLLNTPPDLKGVLETFGLFAEAYTDPSGELKPRDYFKRVFNARLRQVKRDRIDPVTRAVIEGLKVIEYGEPMPEARDGLAKVMLRRLRKDFLNLPPVIEREIRVEAPPDLRAMLDEALGAWESWGDPEELPPFELMSASLAALARSRIPSALEHVRQAIAEGPLVVFSAYKAPVEAMRNLPRTAMITGDVSAAERKQIVDGFQAGIYDCVAGTIDSMGMGLTMTRAARVLLIDEDYTPAMNDQAIGRLLRHGQTQSVLVERMFSDHPLNVRRSQILRRKMNLIHKVVGT